MCVGICLGSLVCSIDLCVGFVPVKYCSYFIFGRVGSLLLLMDFHGEERGYTLLRRTGFSLWCVHFVERGLSVCGLQ